MYGRETIECVRDTLSDNELARYQILKTITDSAKLAKQYPRWLKKLLNGGKAPKPFIFVPNQPPVFPHLTTRQTKPELKIPYPAPGTMHEYIQEFERKNGLRHAETIYVSSEPEAMAA